MMVSYFLILSMMHIGHLGLNPYCSGRWYRTGQICCLEKRMEVLILVVVDDGLVLRKAAGLSELTEES